MFKIIKKAKQTRGRIGELTTLHGKVQTPVFMPVGTLGTVKSLTPQQLRTLSPGVILANTYHLYLRPGMDVIEKAGGLHRFMNWYGPILTDSGGYQVFSLSKMRKISEDGVQFSSHLEGSKHLFTPEKVVDIQGIIGSDIMMVLDECVEPNATKKYVEKSVELTTRWAKRSHTHWQKSGTEQALFGIVQGGMFKDQRKRSVEQLCEMDFSGFAIGGLSVGEEKDVMHQMTGFTAPLLPEDKPRYLMGIGMPEDIQMAIRAGVDMFDCVLPTRLARHGNAFSDQGLLNLNNATFKEDFAALTKGCDCYCCQNFSRAYLAHLIRSKEILGIVLLTLHNINYLQQVVEQEKKRILSE